MEHLRYNALDKFKYTAQVKLFGYWKILLSLLFVVVVLAYLFPKKSLVETLINQPYISEVDFYYSLLLMQKDSGHQFDYNDIFNHSAEVITQLKSFITHYKAEEATNDLWFNYIVIRVMASMPKMSQTIKNQAADVMVLYLKVFEKIVDSPQQLRQLGEDALSVHQQVIAFYFYEKFVALDSKQPVQVYARAGEIALWAKYCEKSANYYLLAQHHSTSVEDKRYFYFKALNILVQCDKSARAIELAEQHIQDGLENDALTFQLLVDLAIMANQTAKAQEFLMRYLQLAK